MCFLIKIFLMITKKNYLIEFVSILKFTIEQVKLLKIQGFLCKFQVFPKFLKFKVFPGKVANLRVHLDFILKSFNRAIKNFNY